MEIEISVSYTLYTEVETLQIHLGDKVVQHIERGPRVSIRGAR